MGGRQDGRKTGRKEGSRRGKTKWQCSPGPSRSITKGLCQDPAGEKGQGTALGCRRGLSLSCLSGENGENHRDSLPLSQQTWPHFLAPLAYTGLPRWLIGKESACSMQETQETWLQSLDQKESLEEETATHSHILAWKIPWIEKPGGLVYGVAKSQTRLGMHTHFSLNSLSASRSLKLAPYY